MRNVVQEKSEFLNLLYNLLSLFLMTGIGKKTGTQVGRKVNS